MQSNQSAKFFNRKSFQVTICIICPEICKQKFTGKIQKGKTIAREQTNYKLKWIVISLYQGDAVESTSKFYKWKIDLT